VADWLRTKRNLGRKPEDQVLLCIDGVHGFGVENMTFDGLGCDFFVAGCHKWIFGPRGTGIWCGTDAAWDHYQPVAPTSSKTDRGPGRRQSPGGLHSFEHRWALADAFRFLSGIGKSEIEHRIRDLATRFKTGLLQIKGVSLVTPLSPSFSAGITCFDKQGVATDRAVALLAAKGFVTTASSIDAGRPDVHNVRASIGIFNSEDEIDRCLAVIDSL
jgi:selenocysteine lyase/cysteine desulfurase